MKLLRLIALLFFSLHLTAQTEYVSNGSFEEIDYCPTAQGQVYLATDWVEPVMGWGALGHMCLNAIIPLPSLPNSDEYFQLPQSGDGVACIWVYNGIGNNYRNYLQNKMVDTLDSGVCYFVRFFVNYKEPMNFSIKNMALSFTNSAISNTGNGSVLNLPEHIYKFGSPSLSDTLPWVEIAGIYEGVGTECYLTIGNFRDDAHTDTVRTSYTSFQYDGSLYFVDNVSVIPVDSLPNGLLAFAGNDATIVAGDSVFIGQEITNLNCNWYTLGSTTPIATNISGIYVSPTITSTYVVEQNLCGITTYDTVIINVSTIGVEELNSNLFDVNLYPNPSSKQITIEANCSDLYITIYDLSGKLVYSENKTTNSGVITIEPKMLSGTYVVKIMNAQTTEFVNKRLIIQR